LGKDATKWGAEQEPAVYNPQPKWNWHSLTAKNRTSGACVPICCLQPMQMPSWS
jgi:hypothetical protein